MFRCIISEFFSFLSSKRGFLTLIQIFQTKGNIVIAHYKLIMNKSKEIEEFI